MVAALTMPSLIANYQKSQFEAGVKKVASVTGQAVTKLMADEGVNKVTETSLLYDPDGDNKYKLGGEFLDKYFNVVGKCETYEQCFGEAYKPSKKTSTSTPEAFYAYYADGCRILADGTSICVYAGESSVYSVDVYFDLTGKRGPNRQGYDLFHFSVYHDGSISEANPECRKDDSKCYAYNVQDRIEHCNDPDGQAFNYGIGCFTYLQQNGFKIDY